MESGNSAAALVCTCGQDLARNGGQVHNYACPMTPKCQHLIQRINLQTGEREQRLCGSRLEPQYASHGHGCPLLPLCPHCGTRMDRMGVHNIDCPNRDNSEFRSIVMRLSYNSQNRMPTMPPARISPQITDDEFEIHGECSICSSSFEPSDQVLKPSGCIHCFHETCLMSWIQSDCSNHGKCPNCRTEIGKILKKKN